MVTARLTTLWTDDGKSRPRAELDAERDVLTPAQTAAFVAVWNGATTIERVAEVLGVAKATARFHLLTLRHNGLVTWEPGHRGTIRPTVEEVPIR